MSDNANQKENNPQDGETIQLPLKIDLSKVKAEVGGETPKEQARLPVYKVETFTDLRKKEVLLFTQQKIKGSILQPPLQIFRGRAHIQIMTPQGLQNLPVVFDFSEEKSVEECFDNFDAKIAPVIGEIQRRQEEQQRIAMPNPGMGHRLPFGKKH